MRQLLRNLALWAFHVLFARPVLYWLVGVRYRRKHHVPAGPCLVVANHNSHLDAALLLTLFPLRRLPHVHPVAAADYFGKTWFMRLMAMLFMNAMPIERHPPPGVDPLAPMVDALIEGETLIFFPEGSRGEAGVVAPFRPGVGRLVRRVPGLLVLPVFLSGPERIWPRGEVVPVPLAIDAIVGKPRTFDSEKDARDIANEVRESVLALAPPPPPPPQSSARAAPPVRVAVCGIDAGYNRDVHRAIVERLGAEGKTLGVSDPVLQADADGVREVIEPVPFTRARAWLGPMARLFRTGGLFRGERFVQVVEQAQLVEALHQSRDAAFVVSLGSALVDMMAWAETAPGLDESVESDLHHTMAYLAGEKKIPIARWWAYVRRAPQIWLVNTFDLAHPPPPDVLVHLRYPPGGVMRRIRSEGRSLQRFENASFLARLQSAYRTVGQVLEKRRKVAFLEFDLGHATPERAVDAAVAAAVEAGRARAAEPVAEETAS